MKSDKTILIVDDDLHILEVLEARLASAGFSVLKASEARQAIAHLKETPVDVMVSDVRMPNTGGFDLLEEAHALYPSLPIVMLTAYGTIPDAVRAVKAGAVEYLTKPFDGRELVKKLQDIVRRTPGPAPDAAGDISDFYFGGSAAMKDLLEVVKKVAVSDVSVLILGESGVGKERIARLIHRAGPRRDHPIVVVDCGSTPEGLLESELFGHVRGAFTHAVRDKKGLIEAADRGTLFLDEIGNISPEMQVRLLRFLEDHKIRKIGDLREVSVNCRIIAATNANLVADVKSGRFREDLYYRLRVVTLKIPPLRDRKEDIPLLARYFIESYCAASRLPKARISEEAMGRLCGHSWPGNVRELKNAVESGAVLCRDGVIRPDDLRLSGLEDGFGDKEPAGLTPLSLDEGEKQVIIRALKEAGGVQKRAAEILGISRRAIHYKIKKYGIQWHSYSHRSG